MNYKVAVFAVLFVLTTGLSAFGVLASIMLKIRTKEPVCQSLVYRQIFAFSFFIYAIWGNILVRELVKSLNMNPDMYPVIAFFIPFIGIPFLVIDWYMLLKFFVNLAGRVLSSLFSAGYFSFFTFFLLTVTFLIRNGTIGLSHNPEVLVIRSIIFLNLIFHLVLFFIVFLIRQIGSPLKARYTNRIQIVVYFSGVLVYSAGFWFLDELPVLLQPLPILVAFVTCAALPLLVNIPEKLNKQGLVQVYSISFEKFCEKYDISKRETEIIREIISGKSNQEIADRLFITLQTVKDHVHRIYIKTGMKNRVQLINLANIPNEPGRQIQNDKNGVNQ